MSEPTRVVLIKPGDVLIIGGLDLPEDRDARDSFIRSVDALKNILSLKQIVVCEDDVSIAAETPPTMAQRADEAIKSYRRDRANDVDHADALKAAWAVLGFTSEQVDEWLAQGGPRPDERADASADYR